MKSDLNNFKSIPALMRGLILFLFLSIFHACSGGLSSVYDFDYPLTEKTAKSTSALVEIKIPKGWFVAEDNENNSTDLWLVKDDYSATIKFIMISMNDVGNSRDSQNRLDKVIELSKLIIKTKVGKSFKGFSEEEIFENGSGKFLAFQYNDRNNHLVRTIIFRHDSKYFEVSAYPLTNANPAEIFKAQNSVLASLK